MKRWLGRGSYSRDALILRSEAERQMNDGFSLGTGSAAHHQRHPETTHKKPE
jgi:hypothetical protein